MNATIKFKTVDNSKQITKGKLLNKQMIKLYLGSVQNLFHYNLFWIVR